MLFCGSVPTTTHSVRTPQITTCTFIAVRTSHLSEYSLTNIMSD